MDVPLIAIVGSIDASRSDYEPPIRNSDVASQACEELGKALAEAGFGLIVYSGDPAFIEADVVAGYVESSNALAESIQIHYPHSEGTQEFKEQSTHDQLFDPKPDPNDNWQVSFYSSLRVADGMILLGGGPSALVAGIVAKSFRKPLVAISTFGGNADTVWTLLRGAHLATEVETKKMGSPRWTENSAKTLVDSLGAQLVRLEKEEQLQQQAEQDRKNLLQKQTWTTLALALGAVLFTALGIFWNLENMPVAFGLMFFATPLLAGSTGGLARNLFDAYRPQGPYVQRGTMLSAVLGMLAGLVAALLFALAQWASNPNLKDLGETVPEGLNLLIPFELLIAFTAGFTLETVLSKVKDADVVDMSPISRS